jgi:hypothetical protein
MISIRIHRVVNMLFGGVRTTHKTILSFLENDHTNKLHARTTPGQGFVTNAIHPGSVPFVTKDIQVRYVYGVGPVALVTKYLNILIRSTEKLIKDLQVRCDQWHSAQAAGQVRSPGGPPPSRRTEKWIRVGDARQNSANFIRNAQTGIRYGIMSTHPPTPCRKVLRYIYELVRVELKKFLEFLHWFWKSIIDNIRFCEYVGAPGHSHHSWKGTFGCPFFMGNVIWR